MDTRSPRLFVRSTSLFFIFMLVVALVLPARSVLAQSPGTLTAASGLLVAPGATVAIPITLASSLPAAVLSVEATVTYDSAKLEFVSAVDGAAIGGWLGAINSETAGAVLFAYAGSAPPIAAGEIVVITLRAKAGATGLVSIGISDILINEQAGAGVAGGVRINTAPVAVADSYSATENVALNVTAPGVLGNDTDAPDGGALTAQLVTGVAHGALTLNANGSFTYTPAANYNGPDSFTYRAVDPWGATSATATVSITVGAVNDAPVASAGGPYSVGEGSSINLNGSATDIDSLPGALVYKWDLDNNGSFETDGASAAFSAATRDGPDTQIVVLQVSDDAGGVDTDSATITINNVAPTAHAGGPYVVDEGASIVLDGSASSDPAGPVRDPLTYTWDYGDGGSTADGTGVAPTLAAAAGSGPANRTITLLVNDGDGGTHSATAALTVRDVVALSLPTLEVHWNSVEEIPVTMSGLNSGLTAINLTITYPPALLTFMSAAGAGLTNGWTATSTPGSGQVQVQLSGSTPLGASSGEVVRLTFTSTSAGGQSGALTISAAAINGGAVSNTRTAGSIRLLARYSVGGAVTYWKDAKPVTGATVTLTGLDAGSTTSTAGGAYHWAQIYEGSHTLAAAKSDQVNGITAYDAALVLMHAVNLTPLTGFALIAADVTGGGGATSADASLILQKSVRLINMGPFPATGAIWRFDPASAAFSLAGNKTQNFTALLMGDVSGNWNQAGAAMATWPASAGAAAAESLPLVLTVERTSATTALLTIALADAPPDTLAMNLEIQLSSAATLAKTTAVQNVMVAWDAPDVQSLNVGIAATRPMQSGAVATLEVALPAGTPLDAPLSVAVVALTINEDPMLVQSSALFLPLIEQ